MVRGESRWSRPSRDIRLIVMHGQDRPGGYQLRRADQVDLARRDRPAPPSGVTGHAELSLLRACMLTCWPAGSLRR